MEPQIQYTKTEDGVSIAFTQFGAGPTVLYLSDVPNTHLQLEWQQSLSRAHLERMARHFIVIRYDPRGSVCRAERSTTSGWRSACTIGAPWN